MYELNNRGVELSKNGKLDEAISVFKEAIQQDPEDSNLYFNIALVYMKKEDFKSAIINLNKSVELFPNDDNLRELGVCYIKTNEMDSAREALVKAVSDYGSSDSENVMGVYFFQISHFEEAKRHFENAVRVDSENRDAWFNLCDTYMELGMEREAKMARYKLNELEK